MSPLARASDNALAELRWGRFGSIAALILCTFSAFLSEFCDMSGSNIDKFNELTAKVLGELYLNFPMPRNLTAEQFVESAVEWSEERQMDLPSKDAEFFFATTGWLINAGYINGGLYSHTQVSDAVLTAKGLDVLNATPRSLTHAHSLREQLAEIAREGGKESFKGLLAEELITGAKIIAPAAGLL
ncbi:hypothetical protein [Pseudomonas bubulae]|uniref:hypothetical protein n=1 Tax=Pseudomonas bubulae TaxID=2316085 RepID=UPI0030962B34